MSEEPQTTRSGAGRKRTAARLASVQALYQIEVTGSGAESVITEFGRFRLGHKEEGKEEGKGEGEDWGEADLALFADLVRGAASRLPELDRMIAAALSPEWPLERLEVVLRAILRVGAYELLARADIPARVVISEYLGLGYAFFSGGEPGMVNGVLDRLARTLRPQEFLPKDDPAPHR
ncbi:MAG TPA: transcription antitermination factor NusB [Stellaceae bacterium]|nr:transcription antitermination factor NusB [Stellaceae bacterium]